LPFHLLAKENHKIWQNTSKINNDCCSFDLFLLFILKNNIKVLLPSKVFTNTNNIVQELPPKRFKHLWIEKKNTLHEQFILKKVT